MLPFAFTVHMSGTTVHVFFVYCVFRLKYYRLNNKKETELWDMQSEQKTLSKDIRTRLQ